MIATLKRSKAQLSDLVDRASKGEEVLITVRGRPKARLCPVEYASADAADRRTWARELREARARWSVGKAESSGAILDELREDRM